MLTTYQAAFNFQEKNFGRGGAENDRVIVSVHAGAGIDLNADFSTPAEYVNSSAHLPQLMFSQRPARDSE